MKKIIFSKLVKLAPLFMAGALFAEEMTPMNTTSYSSGQNTFAANAQRVTQFTAGTLEAALKYSANVKGGVTLVEFYTDKTDKNGALLNEIASEVGGVATIGRINCSMDKSATQSYGIKNVPTFIIFKNDTAMTTLVGARSKSYLKASIDSIYENAPSQPNVLALNARTLDMAISNGTVLVEFYTNKTDKGISPDLNDLSKEFSGKAIIGRVNLSEEKEATKKYNIKNVPTYIVFKNGTALSTFVGACSKTTLQDALHRAQ